MASARAMGCRGWRMYETLTLIKRSRLTPSSLFASASSAAVPPPLIGRVISARPYYSQLAEDQDNVLDGDSSSSSSSTSRSLDNLEKAIHNVMVKRCAPDWLPFKPGSSYWAPPLSSHHHHHRARKFLQLLATFAHSPPLSDSDDYDGEALSISTVRGWPSSSYFIQGTSSPHPVPSEVKVEVKVNKNSENAPQTNDEG